ncbi:hypothetical protein ACF1BN_27755 [Streptomyces sp. NPDC014861]|uniref:hypothetical protein n=1 Tax=Streptomyces sp. NPDC014861 TaxID=3364923 RepID=UPI0036FA4081
MSRLSPAHLRMAGLGTAVAIAVLVPLAAKAGQSDGTGTPPAAPADAKPGGPEAGAPAGGLLGGLGLGGEPGTAEGARTAGEPGAAGVPRTAGGSRTGSGESGTAEGSLASEGSGTSEGSRTSVGSRTSGGSRTSEGDGLSATPAPGTEAGSRTAPPGGRAAGAGGAPERVSRCGPELASPKGVEAQTCVLSEGPDVWARTYYRNATGREIDAILTLMAPGGRTVQVRCVVPARDEPDTCETPREPGAGAARSHTAVAEFAMAGEGGSAPLLLRSGSNTADEQAS